MIDRYKKYIAENMLFNNRDLLVLAVSGGVDSAVLVDLCKSAGFQFVIAHVNFNLREQESVRDEIFVRQLAGKVGVDVFVKRFNTAEYASANNMAIQEAARVLRYEWFEELRIQLVADDKPGSPGRRGFIVTAHHLDDSVETMLMNLFRGTGITGLRGILPLNGHVVRPMLCFTKQEIVDYAGSRELDWVEDSSNQLDKYTRNYFRNQLIPMIRKIYPQVDQNLYNNLDRFSEAAILYREAIERRIKKLVIQKGQELHLPVMKLQKMTASNALLLEILQPLGFTTGEVASVLNLLNSETGKQVIGSSHRVIKNRNWLIIAPNQVGGNSHFAIEDGDKEVLFGAGTIYIEQKIMQAIIMQAAKPGDPLVPGIPVHNGSHIAYLDARKIQYPLLLRRWKTGDYFYPLGMKKKKKIARFMIDAKLSKINKESVWIIESGKKIAWMVGHRIDDRFKLTATTKEVLVLTVTN